MIHICIAVHDKTGRYSKYAAITLCSVFENTNQDVCVHILCDDTVNDKTQQIFHAIAQKYNKQIKFYKISTEMLLPFENMTGNFTIGTLFRLLMVETISSAIDKLLYLDADIIVNMDIYNLWRTELYGYACAACSDIGVQYTPDDYYFHTNTMKKEEYFNAGVMLFNLKYIREKYDFFNDCINFLQTHSKCKMSDQDAMNSLFYGKVLYLREEYNMLTKFLRHKGLDACQGIYHFAGDSCNPVEMEAFDRLFYHYLYKLQNEQWTTEYYTNFLQDDYKQLMVCQAFIKRVVGQYKKKVYWGAGSNYFEALLDVVGADATCDYIVDSNTKVYGNIVAGMTIYSPQKLFVENKDDCVVIVVSKAYYSAIKVDLEKQGFVENKDFFDGLLLLSQSNGRRMKVY